MKNFTVRFASCSLLMTLITFAISCSSPGDGIISKFNKELGTDATQKEVRKGDVIYTWTNVSTNKDDKLHSLVESYMKVAPFEVQPLSPYYDAQNKIIPGKFLKYWVYEQVKFGVELNYIITGKSMIVEVRITQKIGAR